MTSEQLSSRIEKLPESLRRDVVRYIDFLIYRHNLDHQKGAFTFSWEGGLDTLPADTKSVDLQHTARDYR